MYIYQAAAHCDSCGRKLRAKIPVPEGADPRDKYTYDSNEYPKGPFPEDCTDGPEHCASESECLEAIDLGDYGLAPDATLYGAEARKVGAIVCDGLTEDGATYLREMLAEPSRTPYQAALHALWREQFAWDID